MANQSQITASENINTQSSWWQGLISSIGQIPSIITAAKAPGGSVVTSQVQPTTYALASGGGNLMLIALLILAIFFLMKR